VANEIEIVVTAKDRGAVSTIDGIDRKAQGLGGTLRRVGEIAGGFLTGTVLAGAGQKAMQFFGDAIGGAKDLGEVTSKTIAVFGDFSDGLFEMAEKADKAMGLSKTAFLDAASGFGNMFDQLGIGRGEAAKMSTTITGLAADFASFHNADITEVLEAQSAAFRGEYDSVQRFLPLLTAATVEQKAMEITGKANADQLTQQDKALATYQLMLEGAGQALGDFSRTSDGAANAQRIAQAAWENFRTEIGERLLPVFTAFMTWVTDTAIPTLETLGAWIDETGLPALRKLGGIIREEVEPTWRGFQAWIKEELIPNLQELWAFIQENMVPTWKHMADLVREDLLPAMRDLWGAVAELISIFTSARDESTQTQQAFGFVTTALVYLSGGLQVVISVFGTWLRVAAMVVDIVRQVAERIIGLNSVIWGGIIGAVGRVAGAFMDLYQAVASAIRIINNFFDIADRAKGAAGGLAGKLAPAFGVSVKASGGITGAATGGARSGWTMVGEHGAELIKLPAGTAVKGNAMAQNMLAGAGTGGGTVRLLIDTAGSGLDQVLVEILRRVIKSDFGGDVQVAMGAA